MEQYGQGRQKSLLELHAERKAEGSKGLNSSKSEKQKGDREKEKEKEREKKSKSEEKERKSKGEKKDKDRDKKRDKDKKPAGMIYSDRCFMKLLVVWHVNYGSGAFCIRRFAGVPHSWQGAIQPAKQPSVFPCLHVKASGLITHLTLLFLLFKLLCRSCCSWQQGGVGELTPLEALGQGQGPQCACQQAQGAS
jgi:hypothetical protein